MRSQNLWFLDGISPQINAFGLDIERWLTDRPDLALVRMRQVSEMVLRWRVGDVADGVHVVGLSDAIAVLKNARALPYAQRVAFDDVRRRANPACHADPDQPHELSRMARDVRQLYPVLHDAAVWARQLSEPSFRHSYRRIGKKAEGEEAPKQEAPSLYAALALLDEAEEVVEVQRDYLRASAALDRVAGLMPGLDEDERDVVGLRVHSLRLAIAAHRGERVLPMLDEDLDAVTDRLLRSGRLALLDDVALLRNRRAVVELNDFQFDAAEARLTGAIRSRQQVLAAFGTSLRQDPTQGALMGSLGQAFVFQGIEAQDRDYLMEACSTFRQARELFGDPLEARRQDSYLAHTALEFVRRGMDVPRGVDDHLSLSDELAGALASLVENPELERGAGWFDVQLALKTVAVGGRGGGPRLDDVAKALMTYLSWWEAQEDAEMAHPLPSVLGWMAVLLPGSTPRPVRRVLERLAAKSTLTGFIAEVFLAESDRLAGRPMVGLVGAGARFVDSAQCPKGWGRMGLGRVLEAAEGGGGSPLGVLPFYYA